MALKKEQISNKTQGLCKLVIDQELTIYTIETLKQGLSEEIDLYDKFELNLASVEEIDSAGIQLLLALRDELVSRKKTFILTALSSAVTELIDLYAVSDRLNIGDAA